MRKPQRASGAATEAIPSPNLDNLTAMIYNGDNDPIVFLCSSE